MITSTGILYTTKKPCYALAALAFALIMLASQVIWIATGHAAQTYGKLVYQKQLDQGGGVIKLFASYINGGGEVQLSGQGDYSDKYASYSPDGSKIVFVSDRDGQSQEEIYIMNSDGSGQTRLTNTPANHTKYDPSFSPDGSKIIFSEEGADANGYTSIRTMNVNGSGLETMMSGDSENPFSIEFPVFGRFASYSADGSKIVYGNADNIYTLTVSGGAPVTVLDDAYRNIQPMYSPDGSKIVFASNAHTQFNIFIIDANGSNRTRLTNSVGGSDTNPIYSIDGARIVYSSHEDSGRALYSIPVSGGARSGEPYGAGAMMARFMPGSVQVTTSTATNAHDTLTVTENLASQNYTLNDQTLVVGEGGTVGSVTVGDKSVLKGVGTAGAVTVNSGGSVAPGLSPGCLSVGDTVLGSGSSLDIEVGGTTACSGYDRLNVTGTVNVTGATLKVSRYNNFAPAVGNTFTIISNDGSDAIVGTFSGLAEGAEFTEGGYTYQVSYAGGDGNDVTIKVTKVDPDAVAAAAAAPGAPKTGFAALFANPILTMTITVLCATSLYLLSRNKRFINQS